MAKAKNINEYIASAPAGHQKGLKILRSQIKKCYPKATEHISYSMPLFKLDGHPLAGFRAAKNHIGLFVWSGKALGTLGNMLKKYDTAKGTVRFAPNTSLPDRIVKAVVGARAKEIARNWPKKK